MTATAAAVRPLVQGTRRPWPIDILGPIPGSVLTPIDLSTCTGAYLYAHRNVTAANPNGATQEVWPVVIDTATPATATTLRLIHTPAASGVSSVTVAGEVIYLRPMLQFVTGPEIECAMIKMPAVEAK